MAQDPENDCIQWQVCRILLDFRPFQPLAANPDDLLDTLDVLLMNGQMSTHMRGVLVAHLNQIPWMGANDAGGRERTWGAVHLIMTSPEYMVQK